MSSIRKYEISKDTIEVFNDLHRKCLDYDLDIKDNNLLILEKLIKYKGTESWGKFPFTCSFVQCGVFEGKTLLPSLIYSRENNLNIKFYGFDTFEGFPDKKSDFRDTPSYFEFQYKTGKITKEHYKRAKDRTNDMNNVNSMAEHLSQDYFSNVGNIFKIESEFENLKLIKGTFAETLPSFNKDIEILHIDCDLYKAYLDCLNNLYERVVEGGCIIFDEYFSLKYPGARDAVNEFFVGKNGYFENYDSLDNFERWCFIKDSSWEVVGYPYGK